MAREFKVGEPDKIGRDEVHSEFYITELRPEPIGHWANRIVIYGDKALRDHILALLQGNPPA